MWLRIELRGLTRVATFNVNGIRARLPRLIEWLEETRPSVACLQEIKIQDADFPADAFEKIGYGALWHGQKSFNGVAVLADGETPVEVQRGLPGDEADDHARYLEADASGLRVASIYLPNGNPHPGPKFEYKLGWMQRLRERMKPPALLAPVRWLMTLGVALWFLILQPIFATAIDVAGFDWFAILRQTVDTISAASLLTNLTFVGVYLLLLWVLLRLATYRRARRLRDRVGADEASEATSQAAVVTGWMQSLLEPMERRHRALVELNRRVERLV